MRKPITEYYGMTFPGSEQSVCKVEEVRELEGLLEDKANRVRELEGLLDYAEKLLKNQAKEALRIERGYNEHT